MPVIVGGNESGLLDTSLLLLDRNDRSHNTDPGHGEQVLINVSNGNLLIQHRDAFLPSQGEDFILVRTYNSRGQPSDAHQHEDGRWTFSSFARLTERQGNQGKYFEVEYGDGTLFEYRLNEATGLYESTDGAGAFETIEDLGVNRPNQTAFVLTRSNQTRLEFDSQGRVIQSVDTNGVTTGYDYKSDRLITVTDDDGHVLNYEFEQGVLVRVTDEAEGVLVEYLYSEGRLVEVIDRYGHSTQYFYTNDGFLERIVLPAEQDADGDGVQETYDTREVRFVYDEVNWHGGDAGLAKVVTQIIDAAGEVTSFDYDFDLFVPASESDPGRRQPNEAPPLFYNGGSTRVVDALGNARAFSNEQQYVDWRVANGYYASYDPTLEEGDPGFLVQNTQAEAIRDAHSMRYTYGENGYLTEVVDQQGFRTTYEYDDQENLIAVTDRNGWGVTQSDSNYYRALRAELGYTDLAGLGKLVADLNAAEVAELLEAYTSHYEYDDRGNLIRSTDNEDNVTTFVYTAFDKVANTTRPMGHALVTKDDQFYQDKRIEVGFSQFVADLSDADKSSLQELHTTFYDYDAEQNLTQRIDAGGDITRYEYDSFGNRIRSIVFLDANDLADPAKQQVTQMIYDPFGELVETIDPEGNHFSYQYDHFGNLLRTVDGNGGETRYTYDADDRVLSVTDPESHTTTNAYDAVGNRIAVTDKNGHTVIRIFDVSNNLIQTVNASESNPVSDRITQFSYDVVGNQTTLLDAEGRETTYVYDARRQQVEIVTPLVAGPDGNSTRYQTTFSYDGEGNRIRSTNNRNFSTDYLFNQNGLILQRTDSLGHITRFDYDANRNQVTAISGLQLPEALRQVLRFRFDEEDQRIAETDGEGFTTHFEYDAPGNRISATDANGNTSQFEFDKNNRLIREIHPEVFDSITGTDVQHTIEHRFDANGNEVETVDENGSSTRFFFDKDNRLLLVEDPNGIRTVYTYDSRHNRTSVQIGVAASWDAATRSVTVTDVDDAKVTTFNYDEFNQLVSSVDGVGNALAESNNTIYRAKRVSLGFAANVDDLAVADKALLRGMYTERLDYDRVGNQVSQSDHLGRVTTRSYDALNRQISRTDALGNTTTYRYDGKGNRVATIDSLGRTETAAYDANDRQIENVDNLGVVGRNIYDSFGNVIRSTLAVGLPDERTIAYEYDLNNRLIRETDAGGHALRYEYDQVGNRIRVIDAGGFSEQLVYDARNRLIRVIDPLSFEVTYEYDGVGNRLKIVDARGAVNNLAFDPGNRLISTTDGEGRVVHLQYDVLGNQIVRTTALGSSDEEVTQFKYDAEGNLLETVDGEGAVRTQEFDQVYNRTEITDGNGHKTVYGFDALNRNIQVIDATGTVTIYTYDAVGNRLSVTDGLGRVTEFEYDDRNKQIKEIAADGVETHFSYDAVGNRIAIVRAANTANASSKTFVYDEDNLLIAETDALGNSTTYEYDANHNVVRSTDPGGHATTYEYNGKNEVVRIIGPVGNVVTYAYDGNGNRVSVTDGRGNTTTNYYNLNNEIVLTVSAEGFATGTGYDNNGNVVSQTLYATPLVGAQDPNVQPAITPSIEDRTSLFEYDKVNRRVATISAAGFRTETTYDAVGNRTAIREHRDLVGTEVAVMRHYYDEVNREVASLTAEGYLTEFVYDDVGNRIEERRFDERYAAPVGGTPPQALPTDPGRVTTQNYDVVNRLISQVSPLGVETQFLYDSRGNRLAQIEAAGLVEERITSYVYDDADRLVQTTDALGTITRMEHDADGNVIRRVDALGLAEERVTTFVYDSNHRLVEQVDPLGVITRMFYDAAGNKVREEVQFGPDIRAENYEFDKDNRLVVSSNAAGARTEYSYDAAGNRLTRTEGPGLVEQRTTRWDYDLDNRQVAEVDGEGIRTEFRYDGFGNKLETTQAAGEADERHTLYVYDLDNRTVEVTDPEGGVSSYEYDALGNQTRIIDANGGERVGTFDKLGRLLTSLSAGGVLTANAYDARGNLIHTTQSFGDGSDARTTTYGYDLLDRQVLITDGEGYSTTIDYDPFGNQVRATNGQYLVALSDPDYDAAKAARAFAQSNDFDYDAGNRMLRVTDAEGNRTEYAYDGFGNRTAITEAANAVPRTTTFVFDLANRLVETRTPEGGIIRNVYDQVGNKITEATLQSGTEGTGVWISKSFANDDNGRVISETDPLGIVTAFEYDSLGNVLAVISAQGTSDERIVRSEFDGNNRLVSDIDGEGYRTEYSYDGLGNRTKVTDALGREAHYYYDADNRLIAVLDPERYINAFSYDSAGNQTQATVYMTRFGGVIDDFNQPTPTISSDDRTTASTWNRVNRELDLTEPDGSLTQRTYDGAGNILTETLYANTSDPRTRSFAYDLNNRLIENIDVDGTVATFTYDASNNKTEESVFNAADPNPIRTTRFEYDLNNRNVRQIFDPSGLNLVQTFEFDRIGNLVRQFDPNGNATTFSYDLNNRAVAETDALGNTRSSVFDAVGNVVSDTDARGFTKNLEYDGNNRLVREVFPEVTVFTIDGGERAERPTVVHVYDAVGNEVQTVDGNGFINTRYYDSHQRVVAALSADGFLREFEYNAAGDQVRETLYMDQAVAPAGGALHDPAARPLPPAGGEVRTTDREYDLAGRLTRTIRPEIEVTTLSNTNGTAPIDSSGLVRPEEINVFDAFGNQIESFDVSGERVLAYYDVLDRQVAFVDPLGYLTELDYDQQGNVIEQRFFVERLDVGTLSSSVRPTPPAGDVYVTTLGYDAAGRVVQDQQPAIEVFDPVAMTSSTVRPTTLFTYDAAGNQLSRIIGAGTPKQQIEYSYYDASGNLTRQSRFINTVPAAVDLTSLTGTSAATFEALVAANASQDQSRTFIYDGLNQLTSETDLMGPGSADDLTTSYDYDPVGQRTRSTAAQSPEERALGNQPFVTRTQYDGLGRQTFAIGPDGSGSVLEYNAAGELLRTYTGLLDESAAVPAINLGATLDESLRINWTQQGISGLRSWVVYDTASHTDPADYASRTGTQSNLVDTDLSAAFNAPAPGTTVYFRVVTEDLAGSQAWTAEQQVTIPVPIDTVDVGQTSANQLSVRVRFDGAINNATLRYGTPGSLSDSVAFIMQGDGSYLATTIGVADPQALAFRIEWQDASGAVSASAEQPFESTVGHVGTRVALTQTSLGGSDYTLEAAVQLPESVADSYEVVEAQWRIAGSSDPFAVTAAAGTTAGGITSYELTLGTGTPLVAGETYEVVLRGANIDESVVLARFQETVGGVLSTPSEYLSLDVAPTGATQLVIANNRQVAGERVNGRLVAELVGGAAGTETYTVYFTDPVVDDHDLIVDSTEVFEDQGDPPVPVSVGFDIGVRLELAAGEAGDVAGDVFLAYREAGSTSPFGGEVAMNDAGGGVFDTTLARLAAGQYELEVHYFDVSGRKVIVEWQQIADTAVASNTTTSQSQTVVASETNASFMRTASGILTIDPGLYAGPLPENVLDVPQALNLTEGIPGGALSADGLTRGYFTEFEYNGMGHVTATNDGDGLWRRRGVDAAGNAVLTELFGDVLDVGTPITTYALYDARNRVIKEWGAPAQTAGGILRPVTLTEYDLQDNVTAQTDAAGETWRFEYNALGTETRRENPNGEAELTKLDVYGNVTAKISPIGNVAKNYYDALGRLEREEDAAGVETTFGYDAFDRKSSFTDGRGNTAIYQYDQRDRLTLMRTPLGLETLYGYDGRNNRNTTTDANGNTVTQTYDGLNRVTETNSPLSVRERRGYDVYGNLISEVDGVGRQRSQIYSGFNRLIEAVDEGGNRVVLTYDALGRLIREQSPETGKDVERFYDDAGQVLRIVDNATGVTTEYEYDILGQAVSESTTRTIIVLGNEVVVPQRNYTYSYSDLGQLVRWHDSVTGMHLNYFYDADGNLARAFTDLGYDPLEENVDDPNPNFRYVDHRYTYDAAGRITRLVQHKVDEDGVNSDELISEYTYDAAGNRGTWNNAGTLVTYTYDIDNRLTASDATAARSRWTYDGVGNITVYKVENFDGGVWELQSEDINTYDARYRVTRTESQSRDDDNKLQSQVNSSSYDASDRLTLLAVHTDDSDINYWYSYFADGREKTITARGDAKGSSTSTYDQNKVRIRIDRGQGDQQDRPAFTNIEVVDNAGRILKLNSDDGEDEVLQRDFVYALSNPVGETSLNTQDDEKKVLLDTENYSLVLEYGDDLPGGTISTYTAQQGDTLQGIAAALYGNPSLWFVIAEANGLEIVGSTLPNVKAPQKKGDKCIQIIAIIIIVVVAVVVSVVTFGAATAAASAAAAAGISAVAATAIAVGVGIVVGAALGVLGSILTQGLLIAIGYQDEFSWDQVATAGITGAISGAAAGLGAAVKAGVIVGEAVQYVKVAAAAIKVAENAVKQVRDNGGITSWVSLAAAGVGGYLSISSQQVEGANALASRATTAEQLSRASEAARVAQRASEVAQTVSTISEYATPWLTLAETAIRNDGELSASDWVSAIGGTLVSAVGELRRVDSLSNQYVQASLKGSTNLLVGGAYTLIDDQAGLNFLANAVGQEVGGLLGDAIGSSLRGLFDRNEATRRVWNPNAQAFVDANTGLPVVLPSDASLAAAPPNDGGTIQKDSTGTPDAPAADPGTTSAPPTAVPAEADPAVAAATVPIDNTATVRKGDSYWRIAERQLREQGVSPTNAQIDEQQKVLIQLNGGRALHPNDEILVLPPGSGLEISRETKLMARSFDQQWQETRTAKRVERAERFGPEAVLEAIAAHKGQLTSGMLERVEQIQWELNDLKRLDEEAARYEAMQAFEKGINELERALKENRRSNKGTVALPEIDHSLLVESGLAYNGYTAMKREFANSDNGILDRAGALLLGTAVMPVALAEEYISRPILNVPHAASVAGQYAARATLQEDPVDAFIDVLHVIKSSSEAFTAAGSFVPASAVRSAVLSKTTVATSNVSDDVLRATVNSTDEVAAGVTRNRAATVADDIPTSGGTSTQLPASSTRAETVRSRATTAADDATATSSTAAARRSGVKVDANATQYRAVDAANPRLQANAYLREGELELGIRTVLEDGTRGSIRGGEQFAAIIEHFGAKNIKTIKGSWSYGSNLEAFNKGVRSGLSPEAAAARTWTGQQAAGAGFGSVRSVRTYGQNAPFDKVEVYFTR
jgi:YD repeat-containing protein